MHERLGAINVQWLVATDILLARVVRGNKPNRITGDFVDYLIARHKKRIQASIIPRQASRVGQWGPWLPRPTTRFPLARAAALR